MDFFSKLLDILSKKQCYSCKKEGHFLCQNCKNALELYEPFCYICKKYSPNFCVHDACKANIFYDQVIVLTHYKQQAIKQILHDAKYYKKFQVFDDVLPLLSILVEENVDIQENLVVSYPPLHIFSYLKRGYNQSYILAKKISNSLKIPCFSTLKKNRYTLHQAKLDKLARQKNLKDAFKVIKASLVYGKTVILVDDVISTGTTLNECAKVLKSAGVKKVVGLIIASD